MRRPPLAFVAQALWLQPVHYLDSVPGGHLASVPEAHLVLRFVFLSAWE